MRPAFAADPLVNVLFGVTVTLWVISEVAASLRRRSNAMNTDRFSLMILRGCITLGVFLSVLSLRMIGANFAETSVTLGIGLLLLWSGIGLRWWSFWALGRYFTFAVMTSADQPVITSGPYRLLRHPSYAGVLLALTGLGVCFGNWLSLVALLVLPTIGLLYRIRVEEAALSAAVGTTYAAYASGRKRLIPFVW